MKLLHTMLFATSCIMFCEASAFPLTPEVPNHKLFTSPDKQYQAQLIDTAFPRAYDPPTTCLSIKDEQTGTTTLVGVLSPVHAIRWTNDSKCLVLLEHIAGGLQATSNSYADGKWQRHEINPLSEDGTGSFEAIKLFLRAKTFEVTYKVADTSIDRRHPDYYLCTLQVDSMTGTVLSKGVQRRITGHKYIELNFKG